MLVTKRAKEIVYGAVFLIKAYGLFAFLRRIPRWLQGNRGHVNTLIETEYERSQSYEDWIKTFEPPLLPRLSHNPPSFDILVLHDLHADIDQLWNSLKNQTYHFWRLVLVSNKWHIVDERVVVFDTLEAATSALAADYVMWLGSGDWLADWALSFFAAAAGDNPEVIYCDSDDTARKNPFFKPDWSPELMLSTNLLRDCVVLRELMLQHVQALPNHWEYGLLLTENATIVKHIPHVLIHRHDCKPDIEAVYRHLVRQGIQDPIVTLSDGRIRCIWQPQHTGLVSIIIPSRDKAEYLAQCLDSIFDKTTYRNFEVIIVDTSSIEAKTFQLYERYRTRIQVIEYREQFNFSKACNLGTRIAKGEFFVFLNNDTQILDGDWLTRMMQWFNRKNVGLIGAKLLFPDGRIQHAGVLVGYRGMADNLLTFSPQNYEGPYGSDQWYRNLLAVTGACMLVRQDLFEQVGGFNEDYILVFSDVVLCLDIHKLGYRIIYSPDARLIHHESVSRSRDRSAIPDGDINFAAMHLEPWIKSGDPYFSRNLSYRNVIPTFRHDVNDTPSGKPYENETRRLTRFGI